MSTTTSLIGLTGLIITEALRPTGSNLVPIQFLIVEDDPNMLHFYRMVIEDLKEEVELIEASSGDQAIQLFMTNKDFSPQFIICDFHMKNGNGLKFYQFLKHRKLKIPFLVISGEHGHPFMSDPQFNKIETNHILTKPLLVKDLKEVLSLYFASAVVNKKKDISNEFQKVNILFFLRFQKTLCDVYLKLSDKKFIKIFHKESGFEAHDIQKYVTKGIKYLYIGNDDYERFNVSSSELSFLKTLEGHADAECSFEVTQAVLGSLFQSYGLSRKLINKGLEQISKMMTKVQNSKEIMDIFEVRQDETSFYSDHALMISMLGHLTLSHMGWNSEENSENLCLAAILHDALVTEDVANIMEGANSEKMEFISSEEKDGFYSHPRKDSSAYSIKY